ncbi:PilZ domain-containing protein [Treponema sp.]|uniref:PilZ domain-containing protein n=1 Tax=Treponema sp. TaxID=166 RepID=UPI0038901BC2
MRKELRGEERYSEIGRVECEQISALPGVLDDISLSGCKVHFPFPANVDKENEYTIFIQLSRADFPDKLQLLCCPQWTFENEDECQTEIGFSFLRSPDSPELARFIESLKNKNDPDDITSLIIEDDTDFI